MIRRFEVTPTRSVGDIGFGMKRSEVRSLLGGFSEYRNRPKDKNTADCFDICQAFYSDDDDLEFIMFHELDDIELKCEGKTLNKMTKDELFSLFKKLDPDISIETGNVSFESNKLGVACFFENESVTGPDGKRHDIDKLETISFAIKDFWK